MLVSEERHAGSEEVAAPRLVTGNGEWDSVSAAATGDGSLGADRGGLPGLLAVHVGQHGPAEARRCTATPTCRSLPTPTPDRCSTSAPDDRFFSVGPMFHAYGLGQLTQRSRCRSARSPSSSRHDRRRLPRIAEIVHAAPADAVLRASPRSTPRSTRPIIADDTFRSVRLGVSAAEALPAETWHRFHDRFGVEILDGIGSTEMTHIFLSNRAGAVRPGHDGVRP